MIKNVFGLLLLCFITGCASSHVVKCPMKLDCSQPGLQYSIGDIEQHAKRVVPSDFTTDLKIYLKDELRKLDAYSENAPYQIKVDVVDYRMRNDFNRMMFGVMAGKDGVESVVTVSDRESGELLGESVVSSFNAMASGSSGYLAQEHAQQITFFLLGKE